MINLTSNTLQVRLVLPGTDMRKSFTGLNAVIRHFCEVEPNPQYLYIFSNKRRNRVKLLYFDRSGVWVAAKRLEEGRFSWPPARTAEEKVMPLTGEALQLLLDGVDLRGAELREWYRDPTTPMTNSNSV